MAEARKTYTQKSQEWVKSIMKKQAQSGKIKIQHKPKVPKDFTHNFSFSLNRDS